MGENNYTKVGSSVLQATDSDNDRLYEYTPNPPLEFQEEDIYTWSVPEKWYTYESILSRDYWSYIRTIIVKMS